MKWAALYLLLCASPAWAQGLSDSQKVWAAFSFNIGAEYDEGYTLSAIIWTESSYCIQKRLRWSVGCAGLKRSTCRIFDPQCTRARLFSDNEYSIRLGSDYLQYCKQHTPNWRRMVFCFHEGLPTEQRATDEQVAQDAYVLGVVNKIKYLKQITLDHE